MGEKEAIPGTERADIIKSGYLYCVTATNACFAEEGQRCIYDGRMEMMLFGGDILGGGAPDFQNPQKEGARHRGLIAKEAYSCKRYDKGIGGICMKL